MTLSLAVRRGLALALAVAACLVATPGTAWAKFDWIGWLEEFSGPGPLGGYEISAEIACINVTEKRTVRLGPAPIAPTARAAIETARTAVFDAVQAFPDANGKLDPLIPQLRSLLEQNVSITSQAHLLEHAPHLADMLGTQEAVRRAFNALEATADSQKASLAAAASRALVEPARETTELTSKGWMRRPLRRGVSLSCWAGQDWIRSDQERDRDLARDYRDQQVVIARRDWQTGIVLSIGHYESRVNRLLSTDQQTDERYALRMIPVELLFHSKLSRAIDVGAGIGLAWFKTDLPPVENAPAASAERQKFYIVPLSIVVRPGRFFFDSRVASAFGYRLGVRYFNDLDGTYFGLPKERFFQPNEFVWGGAAFFDLTTLFGH
jgi:hypothetical protein